jgi:hypothetical protein
MLYSTSIFLDELRRKWAVKDNIQLQTEDTDV